MLARLIRSEKGFTLVELMIVVLIIAILVAIAIPIYNVTRGRAQARACQANLRTVDGALSTYYADNEEAADTSSGDTWTPATAKASRGGIASTLVPNYLSSIPACPESSGTYTYSYNATSNPTGSVACDNTTGSVAHQLP